MPLVVKVVAPVPPFATPSVPVTSAEARFTAVMRCSTYQPVLVAPVTTKPAHWVVALKLLLTPLRVSVPAGASTSAPLPLSTLTTSYRRPIVDEDAAGSVMVLFVELVVTCTTLWVLSVVSVETAVILSRRLRMLVASRVIPELPAKALLLLYCTWVFEPPGVPLPPLQADHPSVPLPLEERHCVPVLSVVGRVNVNALPVAPGCNVKALAFVLLRKMSEPVCEELTPSVSDVLITGVWLKVGAPALAVKILLAPPCAVTWTTPVPFPYSPPLLVSVPTPVPPLLTVSGNVSAA